MGDKPQIQYLITEEHYCLLARIQHMGKLETCLGRARFLEAIAPLVGFQWQLTVEELPSNPKGAEAPAIVRLLLGNAEFERQCIEGLI